jgi:hypothetical protein
MSPMKALARRRTRLRCQRCRERQRTNRPYCEHCGHALENVDVTPFLIPHPSESLTATNPVGSRRSRLRVSSTLPTVGLVVTAIGMGGIGTVFLMGLIVYLIRMYGLAL